MKFSGLFRILPIIGAIAIASPVLAQPVPKIAVTDLAYSQTVAEYFEAVTVKATSNVHANKATLTTDSQTTGSYVAGTHTYIDHRELGSFSNDIKGALLRGTTFRLVRASASMAGTRSRPRRSRP